MPVAVTAVADNYFSCTQTPIYVRDADLATIQRDSTCGNCKVRITSLIAGTGHVVPTQQGLSFELPQTSLDFNGMHHTCLGAQLTVPAMHRIDISGMRFADISGAELQVYFRGDTQQNSRYTLIIPIRIAAAATATNDNPGTDFFASLGVLQRSRPLLGSILSPDTPMIMYKGTDLEGRTKQSQSQSQCSDTNTVKIFYLVALKPLYIQQKDLTRFKTLLVADDTYKSKGGPITAGAAPMSDTKRALISYIDRITVVGPKGSKAKAAAAAQAQAQDPYVDTAQVKCRPLDTSRDIEGGKVFVGGPGQYRTLKQELEDASDMSKGLDGSPEAGADVSRIETVFAIVIGVAVGLFVISLVVYWWYTRTEQRFPKLKALYAVAKLKTSDIKEVANLAASKLSSPGP